MYVFYYDMKMWASLLCLVISGIYALALATPENGGKIFAEDSDYAANLKLVQESKLPIIWVLGGPGSGKTHQCAWLAQRYGFSTIGYGDIIQAEIASGSDIGNELQSIRKAGLSKPGKYSRILLVREMAKEIRQSKSESKNIQGFLLDDYPVDHVKAEDFVRKVGPPALILYFHRSDASLLAHLRDRWENSTEPKREDDNEEQMTKRIKELAEKVGPTLQKYADRLIKIDAKGWDYPKIFYSYTPKLDKLFTVVDDRAVQ